MAKGKTLENLERGNGASEPQVAVDFNAFSTIDETAGKVRDAFGLADSAVTFGCGQWPHAPVAFDRAALDLRMAQNALALAQARKGSGAWDDETLEGVASKAALAVTETVFQPTLLEDAVDNYLRRYVELPKREGKTLDTSAWSSAEKRFSAVTRILAYPLEQIIPATIPDGQGGEIVTNFPLAGSRWVDAISLELDTYIREQRRDNKKDMKKPGEKAAKTANGPQSAAAAL